MKPNELKQALTITYKANIPTLVWGDAGLGKSEIIKQLGKELGVPVVDLRLATQEVGDLTGVPYYNPMTGFTEWGKPSWWHHFEGQPEAILFLDELNRGTKEVLQAVYQLVLDRRLHTHQLPDQVRIFAAANPPEGDYDTGTLDTALHTRFTHLKLDTDPTQWLDNCASSIHEAVLGYIAASPASLAELNTSFDVGKVARYTSRTWAMAGKIYEAMEDQVHTPTGRGLLTMLLMGTVGPAKATDFIMSLERSWTSVEQLLEGQKEYKDIVQDQADLKRLAMLLPVVIKASDIRTKDKLDQKRVDNLVAFVKALLSGEQPDLGIGLLSRLAANTVTETVIRHALGADKVFLSAIYRMNSA